MSDFTYEYIESQPAYWQAEADKETDAKKKETCLSIKKSAEISVLFVNEVRDLVENQGYEFDMKGHEFGDYCVTLENVLATIFADSGGTYLYNKFQDKENVSVKIGSLKSHQCFNCGRNYMELWMNRETKRIGIIKVKHHRGKPTEYDVSPCEYAEGLKPYSIEINVPSGKMLLANHFSAWYDWVTIKPSYKDRKHTNDYSLNHHAGRVRCTEMQAEQNCAEFNIGNCACKMYRMNDDKTEFMVGGYDESEYKDENDEWQVKYPLQDKGARLVGEVCTSYWGYYVVDKDDFIDRAGEDELVDESENDGMKQWHLKSNKYMDVNEVECVPGRYRFTHVYHLEEEQDGVEIHTRIERIGDCA